MTHSINALNMIASFEGLRLIAYQDGNGIWTIGFGHTGNVIEGQVITKAQANLYLNADLVSTDNFINKVVTVSLTQNQFDALVSFVYNIGIGNFEHSTCLKELNLNNFPAAANAMLLWNKIAGKESSGLDRRREAERTLFLTT